eukprot:scaffold19061_cov71-Phaeocystis_antarctica.AAC.4
MVGLPAQLPKTQVSFSTLRRPSPGNSADSSRQGPRQGLLLQVGDATLPHNQSRQTRSSHGACPLHLSGPGGVLKVCNTNGDGRVGAVVVDLGPDQQEHQALQHAERKARTYGKALLGLASLLYSSSALGILVFKEFRFNDSIPPLSDSKAAAPVGTGLPSYGTGLKGVIVTTPLPFEARPQPPAQPTPRLFGASKDTQPTRNLRQGHARRGPSRQWTRELVHVLCWPAGRLRPVLRFRSVCLGGCRASPMSRPVTYRSLITHISHLLQILRRCIHVR